MILSPFSHGKPIFLYLHTCAGCDHQSAVWVFHMTSLSLCSCIWSLGILESNAHVTTLKKINFTSIRKYYIPGVYHQERTYRWCILHFSLSGLLCGCVPVNCRLCVGRYSFVSPPDFCNCDCLTGFSRRARDVCKTIVAPVANCGHFNSG